MEDTKNDGCRNTRFKVLKPKLPDTTKEHICGEPLADELFDPRLPYNLPEGGKLLHSICLYENTTQFLIMHLKGFLKLIVLALYLLNLRFYHPRQRR